MGECSGLRQSQPVKFCICNEIYQGWPLPEIFRHARAAGYDAVEIAPFTIATYVTDISAARRCEIRDQAAAAGIAISGIHWLLAKTEGLHITTEDAAVRRRTAAYLVDLVRFSKELGGKFLILGSPKQRNLAPGVSVEEGCARTLEVVRDAVKVAEDLGQTLCFEPLAPSETNFINRAADAIALTHRLPSPAFKILLDVKAMCSEAKPIPQIIQESRGEFAYFHANDQNLKGPGFGQVDFLPIGAALHEVGYSGFVSVEVFIFDEGPDVIATRSRAHLRRTFGK